MPEVAVGLMAKYPELGKVKTRLAAQIGDPGALRVYTQLLQLIVEKIRRFDSERFQTTIFVAQSKMVEKFRSQYPGAHQYEKQISGDLGERMQSALRRLIARKGIKRAVLIGADIPDLSVELIEKGAEALKRCDVVFGPTHDGGYYLIGMNRLIPELFKGIDWGTKTVLAESRRCVKQLGLKDRLLEKLSDLDSLQDIHQISPDNQLIIDTLGTYLDQSTFTQKER